ncbi:MAG: hypothetical protein ACFFCS_26355 [Candidatus Hodarchaeota archaeon]
MQVMQEELDLYLVSFDQFWKHSRYNDHERLDLRALARKMFQAINGAGDGSFAECMECWREGDVLGTMMIYKDPDYHSRKRNDVGCFGLVTASSSEVLEAMLEYAKGVFEDKGITTFRGPVNAPRFLFGLGVLVRGFDQPGIAGGSINPPEYARYYDELMEKGFFTRVDTYYSGYTDDVKKQELVNQMDFIKDFEIRNPDLDDLGDLPEQVGRMMNSNLGYRPDYTHPTPETLRSWAAMYKMVPGGEKYLGLFYDGDELVGGSLIMPDWFQLFRGEKVTNAVCDLTIINTKYQGMGLVYNIFQYDLDTLPLISDYYEHSSIWAESKTVMRWLTPGPYHFVHINKEYRVYELETGVEPGADAR